MPKLMTEERLAELEEKAHHIEYPAPTRRDLQELCAEVWRLKLLEDKVKRLRNEDEIRALIAACKEAQKAAGEDGFFRYKEECPIGYGCCFKCNIMDGLAWILGKNNWVQNEWEKFKSRLKKTNN